jgi:hypothetical protein
MDDGVFTPRGAAEVLKDRGDICFRQQVGQIVNRP